MSPKSAYTSPPDARKTKKELLYELQELRAQLAVLKDAKADSDTLKARGESDVSLKFVEAVDAELRRSIDRLSKA